MYQTKLMKRQNVATKVNVALINATSFTEYMAKIDFISQPLEKEAAEERKGQRWPNSYQWAAENRIYLLRMARAKYAERIEVSIGARIGTLTGRNFDPEYNSHLYTLEIPAQCIVKEGHLINITHMPAKMKAIDGVIPPMSALKRASKGDGYTSSVYEISSIL